MAPYPDLNASSTSSPTLSALNLPQPTGFQFSGFNQSQWDPDAIGTIFFGVIMFFIGVTALWQGRQRRLRHEDGMLGFTYEEQGSQTPAAGRPADLADEATESERVAVEVDEKPHEDDTMEEGFVSITREKRTDTEGTLVGHEDDNEIEVKELED